MSSRARPRASLVVLLVSVPAWLLLLSRPDVGTGHAHLGAAPGPLALAVGSLPSLMVGWALMVVAMMTPLMVAPVRHVLERSFKRRRARSAMLFVAGHGAAWMAAGAVLLAAMLALRHLAAEPWLSVAVAGAVAFAWQCSPARQRCMNRSRHHPELAAFGSAADRDALRFGVTHGAWCVGSCWALMLFPLVLPQGHLAAMVVVTLVLISERLEEPRPPRWSLRVPTKLLRIAVAQTRMRLPAQPSSPRRNPSGRADP